MQIQIDMNTINKYIHAQEATVTKANPYIETDELSTKAKSLLVKLVERGFYFKIPTTTLNTLKEELGGELVGELTSNNDVAVITEDTPVNGDVSTNDSTTSTGTLTFAKTTDPIHGTVLFNSNGTYTYTPNSNFNGTDSFTYTVTDSALGESKVNTVTITVNPVSDLVVNDITATIQEGTVLSSTITGTTTSGGVLSYTKTTDPVYGVAVVNMDGSYTYTPETNYHGTDSFTFTVVDSNANESLTGSITITITPVVGLTAADVSVSTDEDVMFTGSLTTGTSTTSGGTLTFTKVSDPLNGVAVVNSNGDYTYTPNSNYSGIDSFDYSVTDSVTLESLTKTVTITVNEVSDLTVTDVITTVSEDVVLNSTVATNASTTSGNTLSFSKATDPVNGTVTINADGTFEYTPASNYNGTDTFDFITTDSVTGETQTKPVIITVTAIGDLEVQAYTNTMVQDTVLEGTLVGVATTTSGGVLEYSKATDPVNGAVVVNTDGTFTYTPTASYVGEDTFDFTVTDEDAGETRTETATITIESA